MIDKFIFAAYCAGMELIVGLIMIGVHSALRSRREWIRQNLWMDRIQGQYIPQIIDGFAGAIENGLVTGIDYIPEKIGEIRNGITEDRFDWIK